MIPDRTNLREWVAIYLKGIFMGTADTIPGVSGGTIALITGIYERLVSAVAAIDPGIVVRLPRARDPDERAAIRETLLGMDLPFLIVLGAGIGTAVVTLSRVLTVALTQHRALTNAFFFGLIGASAIVLYRDVSVTTPRRAAAAIGGFTFAFGITGLTAAGVLPHTTPVVFVTGAITSAAMLLPGISGAALMYVLGQYEFMLGALRSFTDGVAAAVTGGTPEAVLQSGIVVVTFLGGVAVGLVTIAHVVRWALRRDRTLTLTVLVSLMVGALRLPAREIIDHTGRWSMTTAAVTGLAVLLGAAAVLLLDHYTDDLDYV